MFDKSVFIFTRDLRLADNTSLIKCSKLSKKVIPLFIVNNSQIINNTYKSNRSIMFMKTCLMDLKNQIKELVFINNLPSALRDISPNAVFLTMDYTPYARKRYNIIKKYCDNNNILLYEYEDYMLVSISKSPKTQSGKYYEIFSKYYNKSSKLENLKIDNYIVKNFEKYKNGHNNIDDLIKLNIDIIIIGGRKNAFNVIKNKKQDELCSSNIAAYIKYGCISVREARKLQISQENLHWRDFYYQICYHNPHVLSGYIRNFRNKKINWSYDKRKFRAWTTGTTGYNIVDACMNELNQTGLLSNRSRLIVADFLIKYLGISWELGEKHFAKTLIDYDPMINNGNWQYVSGTGASSQPWFRYMNPESQQKKYDPNNIYINKWNKNKNIKKIIIITDMKKHLNKIYKSPISFK